MIDTNNLKVFFLFVLGFLIASVVGLPEHLEWRHKLSKRDVNNLCHMEKIRQLEPYVATVRINGYDSCKGAVLSSRHVIAPRVCAEHSGEIVDKAEIALGVTIENNGDAYQLRNANITSLPDSNLVILTMSSSVELGGAIKDVTLSEALGYGEIGVAFGWIAHCNINGNWDSSYFGADILNSTVSNSCYDDQSIEEFCVAALRVTEGQSNKCNSYQIGSGSPVISTSGELLGFTRYSCSDYGYVDYIEEHNPAILKIVIGFTSW